MGRPHVPPDEQQPDHDVLRHTAAALPLPVLVDLVNETDQGLATLDENGLISYVNAAGAQVLGLSPHELIGRPSPFGKLSERTARSGEPDVRIATASDGRSRILHFRSAAQQRRARQATAFADTAAAIAQEPALDVVLDRLADEVRSVTGMPMCAVVLIDGTDEQLRYVGKSGLPRDYPERLEAVRRNGAPMVTTEAFRLGRPVVAPGCRAKVLADPRWSPAHELLEDVDWDTFVAVPLVVRRQAIGALTGFHPTGHHPDDEDVRFLSIMADQAAIAVDNARMFATLKLRAADAERERLARDLHDSVNQALFSLSLKARGIELTFARQDNPDLAAQLADVRQLAQNALSDMRALIQFRRPAELRDEGLLRGLERLAAATEQRTGLRVRLEPSQEHLIIDDFLEDDLFRFVQEALNNVVKHARATEVDIVLRPSNEEPTSLVLEVIDDGIGLRPSSPADATFGMATMRERAERHGARFEIGSGADGHGTVVRIVVPGVLTGPDRGRGTA
jgi:signal transduction histidine kinase